MAWLDSSLELSPRSLSLVLARMSSYSKVPVIVQPIQGSPRPNCRELVVELVSPAHKNEASNLVDSSGCQHSPKPLATSHHITKRRQSSKVKNEAPFPSIRSLKIAFQSPPFGEQPSQGTHNL